MDVWSVRTKVDNRSETTNAVRQHNNKLNIAMATTAAASSANTMKLMMNTWNYQTQSNSDFTEFIAQCAHFQLISNKERLHPFHD